ncbi:MAG: hypothetical protein U0263_19325 [Polyangiaceae bacterium]
MSKSRVLGFVMLASASSFGCQKFDPPPEPNVVGLDNGVMTTAPDEPVVLEFSEPFVESSLRLKLVKAIKDSEGNLLDEQSPPDLEGFRASTLVAFDGAARDDDERSFGASFELTNTSLVIDQEKAFGVSEPYLLLIEPGLEDLDGHQTVPRIRKPFTYELQGGGSTLLPTGYYYFILNVEYLATQIQVFTYMEVDPVTGAWRASFTNANRLEKLNKRPECPASCPTDTPVCALIPTVRCVKPSEKQTSLEQFVDFLPEVDPPNGYKFIADGFAKDQANATTAFGTSPFLIEVTVGTGGVLVDAENTRISGVFRKHDDGRWRATGSLSVEVVKLNGIGNSPTKGTFEAMSLTDAEVKDVESYGFAIPKDLSK